jgi:SAM-dependent methyltransferase
MHPSAHQFFERVAKQCARSSNVLEVGSMDVNGNLRDLFDVRPPRPLSLLAPILRRGRYTGVDMRSGPNVDIVANARALPFADGSFDVVVCASTLEHDTHPWLSAAEMTRVLKPDGLMAISVPGFMFPRHEFPDDFWRFSAGAVQQLFPSPPFEVLHSEESESEHGPDVFFLGRKLATRV